MSRNDVRERQWQETLEVAAALQGRPAVEPGAAPRPGELYLSRRTASFPVEWLVIEAAAGGRFRVVPVDDYPLVGSRDVELPAPPVGGVAVARCGVDAWAEAGVFEPELRTGVVEEGELERVRARRRAVEAGGLEPTLLEEEADGDPDYLRWVEGSLRRAAEVLGAEVEEPSWAAKVVPFVRRGWPVLAAAAVLALIVGVGGYVRGVNERLAAERARVAELERVAAEQGTRVEEEARQRQVAEQEAERLDGLWREAQDALGATEGRLEAVQRELRQAVDLGAVVNVKKLVFGDRARFTRSGTRGEPLMLKRGSSRLVFLELEVVDAEPYPSYRLRFVPTKGGKALTVEGISREGAWLRLGLRPADLVPGEYDLLIDGVGFGGPMELAERYRLTIEP